MSILAQLGLVSPTEGQSPPTFSAGAIAGSGSQFEARAASAFTPSSFGVKLPTMSTSFRRLEYQFTTTTSGTRVWAFGWSPTAFSASNTFIASFTNAAKTGQADLRVNTSGASRTLSVRNIANGNTTSTGSATYSVGSQYRLEFSVTISGNIELRTYLWGSDTLIEAITLAATSITELGWAYMGITAAASGYAAEYGDKPTLADTWIGSTGWAPAPGAAALSGTGTLSAGRVIVPLFTYPMTYPAYPSHRGAMGPEETQGSYDRSLVAAPRSGLEGDVQEASDGYVLSHDDTTTRTAASGSPFPSSTISTLTVAQVKTVLTKDLSGRGFSAENMMGLSDWFARYGPQDCWLIPELKNGSDANAFADFVIATGYASKTIVQAFSRASAEILAGRGLETAHLIASGGATDWAAIKAAGINHVVRNSTLWTSGDITAAKAAGLKAGVFTIETVTDRNTQLSNGINGLIFTDFPDLLNPGVTLALSGTGTLTAVGTPSVVRAAALSGSGSLVATGAPGPVQAVTLSGSGSLSATGVPRPAGTAALSGSGSLVASGSPAIPRSASLSGSGTLSATGQAPSGAASLSGVGTLTTTGIPRLARAAALSGLGTLTAIGVLGGGGPVTGGPVKVWTGADWVPLVDKEWVPSGSVGTPTGGGEEPVMVWTGSRWIPDPREAWIPA